MKKFAFLQYLVLFGLLIEFVIIGGVCVTLLFPERYDVSSRSVESLSSDSVEYIKSLDKRIYFTYVTSPREQMPSSMKRVERNVRTVLEQFRRAAPEMVDFETMDPSGNEEIANLVSRKKVSRWHMENIASDRSSEKVVWSSLVISMGEYRDVVIDNIGPEHARLLEKIIVSSLKNMAEPVVPVIGISAPMTGYSKLYKYLSEQGRIATVDLEKEIPERLDILYIIEPKSEISHDRVMELKRLIERGTTVVYVDSLYGAQPYMDSEKNFMFNVQRKKSGENRFLKEYGISFKDVILLDERCESFSDGRQNIEVPFAIRAIQTSFNLKNFAGDFSGNLSFMESAAIGVDEQSVAHAGFIPQTIVTSSEKVWTMPIPEKGTVLGMADLSPVMIESKQPVAVMVSGKNPFSGKLLVFASKSIFSDNSIEKEGFGHRPFLKLMGRTFLSPSRLVNIRVERELPELLTIVNSDSTVFWRVINIFLIPAFAFIILIVRKRSDFSFTLTKKVFKWAPVAVAVIGCFLLTAAVSRTMSGTGLDLTSEKLNTISSGLSENISSNSEKLKIVFYVSGDKFLTNELKKSRKKTISLLEKVARIGGDRISFSVENVDQMTEPERTGLIEDGIIPGDIEVTEYESKKNIKIWNSVAVTSKGKTFTTPFINEKNIGSVEFFILQAARSAIRGKRYHIAAASDMPRLSPAEAFEDYFKKQLSAPIGSDVYSDAKKLLVDHGFRVSHVDQKSNVIPADADVLIWFQPRRPVEGMAAALSGLLYSGRNAMVAMQHYNIQQRQYSGRDFRTVYWPQPQYMDLNLYLELMGLSLQKEVFMDSVQSAIALETQINRTGVREYDRQAVAKPFLIRTIDSSYTDTPVISSRLGDLLFVWGNRIVENKQLTSRLGFFITPLILSSDKSWVYDWQGGFLEDSLFVPSDNGVGPQPLAVAVEGNFHRVDVFTAATDAGSSQLQIVPGSVSANKASLILTGNSEMFKNQHLKVEGFSHDRYLINMAAYLTMGADSVQLLFREFTPAGFEHPGRDQILSIRFFVIGGASLIIILFSLTWLLIRSRKRTVLR